MFFKKVYDRRQIVKKNCDFNFSHQVLACRRECPCVSASANATATAVSLNNCSEKYVWIKQYVKYEASVLITEYYTGTQMENNEPTEGKFSQLVQHLELLLCQILILLKKPYLVQFEIKLSSRCIF